MRFVSSFVVAGVSAVITYGAVGAEAAVQTVFPSSTEWTSSVS